jgi:hypothetical protein
MDKGIWGRACSFGEIVRECVNLVLIMTKFQIFYIKTNKNKRIRDTCANFSIEIFKKLFTKKILKFLKPFHHFRDSEK